MRFKRVTPWILSVAVFYVGLIIINCFISLWMPTPQVPIGLFVADPLRGHAPAKRFSGTVTTTYSFPVEINSRGYRGGEWNLSAPVRIAVVGDSFTFGDPLPVEDGFVAKAAAGFSPDRVQFYNLGVSGYGPAQILPTVESACNTLLPTHFFYMNYVNDSRWDNLDAASTTVINGYLVHTRDTPGGPLLSTDELHKRVQWSLSSSGIAADIITLSAVRSFAHRAVQTAGGNIPFESNEDGAYSAELSAEAARLIVAMSEAAHNCGAGFTMVILPNRMEVKSGAIEPASRRLIELLKARNIEIIDLHGRWPQGADISLPKDGHYNSQTTTIIAEILQRRTAQLLRRED